MIGKVERWMVIKGEGLDGWQGGRLDDCRGERLDGCQGEGAGWLSR